jgi:hypothetical protein
MCFSVIFYNKNLSFSLSLFLNLSVSIIHKSHNRPCSSPTLSWLLHFKLTDPASNLSTTAFLCFGFPQTCKVHGSQKYLSSLCSSAAIFLKPCSLQIPRALSPLHPQIKLQLPRVLSDSMTPFSASSHHPSPLLVSPSLSKQATVT